MLHPAIMLPARFFWQAFRAQYDGPRQKRIWISGKRHSPFLSTLYY